jgi:hypothetical protein
MRWVVACIAAAALVLGVAGNASAAVPFVDIGAASGPLTSVAVGNDLSCQVKHTGDTSLEFFPSGTTPGDCGTFLAVGGTLFTPDFNNHGGSATSFPGGSTPFTAGSQTAKTGAGTSANPFKVVTTATAGSTGLTVTQTDTYVTGQESYRTDVAITNGGSGPQNVVLYRAGDCFLQNSDRGFGFSGPTNSVGCSATANNTPPGRIEEFFPITGGNTFLEDVYSNVWAAIGTQMPFTNQCAQCTNQVDNGAGISWSVTIQPGQTVTLSSFTTFSPTGRTGPPPPPPSSTDLQQARTPNCLSVPSVIRNRVQNVRGLGSVILKTRQVDNPAQPLRLSVVGTGRVRIAVITFQVNGRILTAASPARTTNVLLSFLRIGSRFRNKVVATVLLANGRVVQLTQFMVILRCHPPVASCRRQGNLKRMKCTANTPLGGRRVRVTVTQSAAFTATGSASVSRGRYTVFVFARVVLPAGVYAYKAIVTTNRRGERFQMIRLVTVR